VTDEVADWTGNWDRRPSTSIANLECQRRTSTIMIIIVGPMIGTEFIILPGVGHLAPLEAPDELAAGIAKAVSRMI
jgi:hypothetical protein